MQWGHKISFVSCLETLGQSVCTLFLMFQHLINFDFRNGSSEQRKDSLVHTTWCSLLKSVTQQWKLWNMNDLIHSDMEMKFISRFGRLWKNKKLSSLIWKWDSPVDMIQYDKTWNYQVWYGNLAHWWIW